MTYGRDEKALSAQLDPAVHADEGPKGRTDEDQKLD